MGNGGGGEQQRQGGRGVSSGGRCRCVQVQRHHVSSGIRPVEPVRPVPHPPSSRAPTQGKRASPLWEGRPAGCKHVATTCDTSISRSLCSPSGLRPRRFWSPSRAGWTSAPSRSPTPVAPTWWSSPALSAPTASVVYRATSRPQGPRGERCGLRGPRWHRQRYDVRVTGVSSVSVSLEVRPNGALAELTVPAPLDALPPRARRASWPGSMSSYSITGRRSPPPSPSWCSAAIARTSSATTAAWSVVAGLLLLDGEYTRRGAGALDEGDGQLTFHSRDRGLRCRPPWTGWTPGGSC